MHHPGRIIDRHRRECSRTIRHAQAAGAGEALRESRPFVIRRDADIADCFTIIGDQSASLCSCRRNRRSERREWWSIFICSQILINTLLSWVLSASESVCNRFSGLPRSGGKPLKRFLFHYAPAHRAKARCLLRSPTSERKRAEAKPKLK